MADETSATPENGNATFIVNNKPSKEESNSRSGFSNIRNSFNRKNIRRKKPTTSDTSSISSTDRSDRESSEEPPNIPFVPATDSRRTSEVWSMADEGCHENYPPYPCEDFEDFSKVNLSALDIDREASNPSSPSEEVPTSAWSIFSNLTDLGTLSKSVGYMVNNVVSAVSSMGSTLSKWYLEETDDDRLVRIPQRDDTDDEDEERFEDALEQLEERDRLHHICHELMTTEEEYVKRLGILVCVKEKTVKILKPEIANSMFQNIEIIYSFHKDSLLPQLQERLKYWEVHRKVGDIMKRLAPFLKLYTGYIQNFQKASELVKTYEVKSNTFAKMLKEMKATQHKKQLLLKAYMLEPVQRVPRYELLLKEYLRKLPEDSSDKQDVEEALRLVTSSVAHYEEMMKRDSRLAQLIELQSRLVGSVNVFSSTRELMKQGRIVAIGTNNKQLERTVILFNDMLLICSESSQMMRQPKYKVKQVFDLEEVQVSEGNNLEVPNTFYVTTKTQVVELKESGSKEKIEWQKEISEQVLLCTREKLGRQNTNIEETTKISRSSLGKRVPVPVHQNEVSACLLCSSDYSVLRRKRNCAACGNVVCSSCSSRTMTLEYDNSKPLRICDYCFLVLQEQDERKSTNPTSRQQQIDQSAIVLEGQLSFSGDNGLTSETPWFRLFDNGTLCSYKAQQDTVPWTSLKLAGYMLAKETTSSPGAADSTQVVLEDSKLGKKYTFWCESATVLTEWENSLRKVILLASESSLPSSPETPSLSRDSR